MRWLRFSGHVAGDAGCYPSATVVVLTELEPGEPDDATLGARVVLVIVILLWHVDTVGVGHGRSRAGRVERGVCSVCCCLFCCCLLHDGSGPTVRERQRLDIGLGVSVGVDLGMVMRGRGVGVGDMIARVEAFIVFARHNLVEFVSNNIKAVIKVSSFIYVLTYFSDIF